MISHTTAEIYLDGRTTEMNEFGRPSASEP